MSLKGKVALVTGASRGIGRGIALQLGEAGATVYITGRKPEDYDETTKLFKVNQLQSTADEINKRGGKGISVFVDHSDATAVKALYDQIDKEQHGQLDIVVNNAYAAVPYLFTNMGKKFYELDPEKSWDLVNNVGLRNNYISAIYAAKLMIPRKTGLIVIISSFGGMNYLFNTSYGVGKAGNDRLAADIAVELRGTGVSAISLWPGAVKTEIVTQAIISNANANAGSKKVFSKGESIEFPGKAIVALATDPNIQKESGKVLLTYALARKYNIFDIDGTQPETHDGRFDGYVDLLNKYRVENASADIPLCVDL